LAPELPAISDVRTRLREWDREHGSTPESLFVDVPITVDNDSVNLSAGARDLNLTDVEYDDTEALFGNDEELSVMRRRLGPGDLVVVNIRYPSLVPRYKLRFIYWFFFISLKFFFFLNFFFIAKYLSRSGDKGRGSGVFAILLHVDEENRFAYLFAETGQIASIPERALDASFAVTGFVKKAVVQPFIPILNMVDDDQVAYRLLEDKDHSGAKESATRMLAKMSLFSNEADIVYQNNMDVLNEAINSIGDASTYKHLTLEEIAANLVPNTYKKNGKFYYPALFAVHKAILADDLSIRPYDLRRRCESYLYEASPFSDRQIANKVKDQLQQLLEAATRAGTTSLPDQVLQLNGLGSFIIKARKAISMSRSRRTPTGFGMISPPFSGVDARVTWNTTDLKILRFFEIWTGCHDFATGSKLNSVGHMILRIVDMYEGLSELLSAAVGWEFLQELGWVAPWEISERHLARIPGVQLTRDGAYKRHVVAEEKIIRPDIANSYRKDWDKARVYAFDHADTSQIDDAISVEPAENPGEHWVHVHVADPTANLYHHPDLIDSLAKIPISLYLAGRSLSMLAGRKLRDTSLASGRPCLTFSGKISADGTLLDYKIEPGTLHDIVRVTMDDVSAAIAGQVKKTYPKPTSFIEGGSSFDTVLVVGKEPPASPAVANNSSQITALNDLSSLQIEDLYLFNTIAESLQNRRLRNGAWPFNEAELNVNVSTRGIRETETEGGPGVSQVWHGDPYIRVSYESTDAGRSLVGAYMALASEVASKWCHKRNIPVPHRIIEADSQRLEKIRTTIKDEVIPLLEQGKIFSSDLIGKRFLTRCLRVQPGRNDRLGLDMYVQCTSPMRRFVDLVVHWQVHAVLAEERRIGRSLAGEDVSTLGILPFERKPLTDLMVSVDIRESNLQKFHYLMAPRVLTYQALFRAWHFKEAELPETFLFTIASDTNSFARKGRLNFLELMAVMTFRNTNGLVTSLSEITVGDVFEVKISKIYPLWQLIVVEAVRRVGRNDWVARLVAKNRSLGKKRPEG
jgi:hypothetical protein